MAMLLLPKNKMKISFSTPLAHKSTKTEYPYVATYPGPAYVLVTGPGETDDYESGIMINGNIIYKPFEYQSPVWDKRCLTPFKGIVNIECL